MSQRWSRRQFLQAMGIAAAGVLAGCAAPTPVAAPEAAALTEEKAPEATVTELTWWNAEPGGVMLESHKRVSQDILARFHEQHPGIRVKMEFFPEDGFFDKVTTAIAAGAMADLWQGFYATEISRRGFLAELTPFMERDAVKPEEVWFKIGQLRASYQGKYYAVPRDGTAAAIVYNQDLFDEFGIAYPEEGWTAADYREIAIKLTNEEKGTYGLGGNEGSIGALEWGPFSYNLGVDFVSEDGHQVKGYLDAPEAIAAMQWYLDLSAVDKVTTAGTAIAEQFEWFTFLSGKVGMQSISSWEIPELDESAQFRWGLVAPPRKDEKAEQWAWTDAILYYLWSGSKHKDEGWEFLKFVSGPEAGKMAAEARVWAPPIPEVWTAVGWDKDATLGVFWKEMQKPTRVPNYLRSEFQWECIQPAWDAAWSRYVEEGERPLEAIVQEEVETAQKCLDEAYAEA